MWRRRVVILLGLAVFGGLVMAGLSASSGGAQLHEGLGYRRPLVWSDWGLLLTLIVAAPVVVWAAVKNWNRR